MFLFPAEYIDQIQQEFGERKSASAPGLPRSPPARDINSRLTSKSNAVGRERSHSAEAARGRQNIKLGIDRLAVGARLGAGTGAGAARDEALNQGDIINDRNVLSSISLVGEEGDLAMRHRICFTSTYLSGSQDPLVAFLTRGSLFILVDSPVSETQWRQRRQSEG